MPKVKDQGSARRQREFRVRRKQRDKLVDEVFMATMKAEGGVQWTLDAVKYEADAVNPLGDGLKITWLLSKEARDTLREYADSERGLTFDAMLQEMDAKLLVWFVQIGLIQHDYRLKEGTDGN